MGTTSGFVFVYDVENNQSKTVFSVKGHDGTIVYLYYKIGNIKNILWRPQSSDVFLSSSYEN